MGGPYKTEASACRDRSDPGGAEASVSSSRRISAPRSAASSCEWVEKRRSFPAVYSFIIRAACCFVSGSRPVKGSSMRTISAGARMARRMAVRRFMPPENSDTGFLRESSGRRCFMMAVSSWAGYPRPVTKRIFWRAVYPSSRRSSWKTAEKERPSRPLWFRNQRSPAP